MVVLLCLATFDLAQTDEADEFVGAQASGSVGSVEHTGDKLPLVLVQGEDLLLDGVLCHEPIDRHGPLLAEPVGSVGRLILDGRVPPRIHVDDVIGCRQIQSRTTGLERDQKQIPFASLEGINGFLSLGRWSRSIEVLVTDPDAIERFSQEAQVLNELAEYQCSVFALSKFADDLHE